jgi:small acid-soluble spore protein K (minor)
MFPFFITSEALIHAYSFSCSITYYKYASVIEAILNPLEVIRMRNKAKDFPIQSGNKFEGEPRAKDDFAPIRANGTINTHPQERMRASGERNDSGS